MEEMDDLDSNLGFLLHEVARLMRKRFEQNARDLGLTRSQGQVLVTLANNEGIPQGALAEKLGVEPITLTRILDRLEEAGLIERLHYRKDRRVRLLRLTPAASAARRHLRYRHADPRRGDGGGVRRGPRSASRYLVAHEGQPGRQSLMSQ